MVWSVVLTTTESEAEGEAIASALIEAKLAACVSLFPIKSIYTWQGKVERSAEWQLLIKTRRDQFEAVEALVKSLHSYEVPELILLPIEQGSADYLGWMGAQVNAT